MRFNFKAAVRGKKSRQVSGQRMLELARGAELLKVTELFFHLGIKRPQADLVIGKARNLASSEDVDGKIYGDCAGVK